ncbi:ACT domain protein [Geobacillus sp. BCO2]|nr:ACT domain protein [Geobacillus sp. BCO2]
MLGDVASLLGMLSINIVTINGVRDSRRGMLLLCDNNEQIERLATILRTMDNITVTKLRQPKLLDRLAVRHGRYIQRDADDKKRSASSVMNLDCLSILWRNFLKKKGIS